MKKFSAIFLILILSISFMSVLYLERSYGQTLAWGSSGEDVRIAQSRLKQWGYLEGGVDGVFGKTTYDAVIKFQKANGLTPDGVIGAQTRVALGMSSNNTKTNTPASRGVSRSDDIHLLARAIHAESKGEPYLGQVAVGAVMLNRIKHPSFPNTLAGVVYQPCAFEPVKNGTINEAPDDSAYNAARDVLNGWDPTGGAIYFWNPSTATSKWIWSRKVTLTIGRHVFAHD
ncbi:spore cortex-lytic enzyme [Alkaliphilus oremlandii]|uniref:Spore cortex-lytic enzyme n=1 Tax=Alkaliphilus oremlandii (strain OhILAs) TaxID=350688 RepID=A8MIH6_ALKOO|nr:spore cortex-lytic enzyme [Alkaliphilus oremlandii]ABW19608.1 Spore cortex-lytic enzyme SleB [Alkaliphilus oremlandii OhILAs]